MKIILLLGLALVALAPAQAQVFRPASFRGGHVGHGGPSRFDGPRWGVSIYAPLALGTYAYRTAPVIYSDYDYGYDGGYYAQPSYQATGTWLGAIAGAIIGRNSGSLGHDAWRGAAYGAGLGYIFGAVADSNARTRAAVDARRQLGGPITAPAAPAAAPAQPVTIINNYYNTSATPMSSANSLFGRN